MAFGIRFSWDYLISSRIITTFFNITIGIRVTKLRDQGSGKNGIVEGKNIPCYDLACFNGSDPAFRTRCEPLNLE